MDKIYNYFNDRDDTTIINRDLIKINTILKNINTELCLETKLEIPTLIVIGSQSSGKSTLLNRLMGFEVIPMGSTMETRTPINIELINTNSTYIEFGYYKDLMWTKTKKIVLDESHKIEKMKQIADEIRIQTKVNAGEDMGVSDKEINIKFYSPHIPNLNFIDLPGLTMIACTDRGQPKNIKDQIRNLLIKYISNPNNLILCVMPAREDIETDMALELVKEYDTKSERTIGVLTKVDLMNVNNDISNYILDNISKDLKLKYGYFAIKNSINEMDYFNNHETYSKMTHLNKFGIKHLGSRLSAIFINKIKENIPTILEKLNHLILSNKQKIMDFGTELPSSHDAKHLIITKYVTNISNHLLDNLENRYSKYNTGRKIKEIFIKFRSTIDSINPFSKNIDELLIEIIKNSDGNHMSMPLPTIEILEGCLLSPKLNCYEEFEPSALECLNSIKDELYNLLSNILKEEGITKYKNLHDCIQKDIYEELILKKHSKTIKYITESIKMEKSYIWTDNECFLNLLKRIPTTFNSTEIDITILKDITSEYFNSIKEIIKHNIPKVIMYNLIRGIEKDLNLFLLNKLQQNNYLQFLIDDKEMIEKRKKYKNIQIVLTNSKHMLENI